jgi:hypothetical protein
MKDSEIEDKFEQMGVFTIILLGFYGLPGVAWLIYPHFDIKTLFVVLGWISMLTFWGLLFVVGYMIVKSWHD